MKGVAIWITGNCLEFKPGTFPAARPLTQGSQPHTESQALSLMLAITAPGPVVRAILCRSQDEITMSNSAMLTSHVCSTLGSCWWLYTSQASDSTHNLHFHIFLLREFGLKGRVNYIFKNSRTLTQIYMGVWRDILTTKHYLLTVMKWIYEKCASDLDAPILTLCLKTALFSPRQAPAYTVSPDYITSENWNKLSKIP